MLGRNVNVIFKGINSILCWTYNHNKIINPMFLFCAFALYLAGCYKYYYFVADDAFISFRYADNIAAGYGISWNYDKVHVLGFSNLFMVLIQAAGIKLGLDPLNFSKILNISAGLSIIIMIGLMTKLLLRERFKFYFVPSLIWAFIPAGWAHSVSGMETILFSAFVLSSIYVYLKFLKSNNKILLLPLNILLILTILCRYEGALFTLGIIIHQIYLIGLPTALKLKSIKKIVVFGTPFFFLVALIIWNKIYFGQYLPNPFYVKYRLTVEYLVKNLFFIFKFLALFLGPFLFLIIINLKSLMKNRLTSYLILQSIVFILPFFIFVQAMNYLFRFYYPLVALFIVAAVVSLSEITELIAPKAKANFNSDTSRKYSKRTSRFNLVRAQLTAYGLIFLILFAVAYYEETRSLMRSYGNGMNEAHIPIGQIMGNYDSYDNYTVATVVDAGAIPYYSGWYTYDFTLNDYYSAKYGFDVERFYEFEPDMIVMSFFNDTCSEKMDSMTTEEGIDYLIQIQPVESRKEILAHQAFQNYTLITVYKFQPDFFQYVFMKNDAIMQTADMVDDLKNNSNYW
jgi:hypothetical protein